MIIVSGFVFIGGSMGKSAFSGSTRSLSSVHTSKTDALHSWRKIKYLSNFCQLFRIFEIKRFSFVVALLLPSARCGEDA